MKRARTIVALLLTALALQLGGCVDKPTERRVRANAYLRSGEAKRALEEIDEGLKTSKDDVPLLILRGKALFELDRLDEAKAAYAKSLEAGKDLTPRALAEAQLGLAIVATRKQDWKEARARFEKLVEINDKDADARLNVARTCLRLKDMKCAVAQAEEAAHIRGNAEDVLFTLGRIYVVAKRYDDAEKTFNHICDVVKGAASCPYGVALVAAQKGDKAKALKKLEEAIARKLPNPGSLAKDELLAPIKDDPAFKKLAESASKG